jgi:hypothetical protein
MTASAWAYALAGLAFALLPDLPRDLAERFWLGLPCCSDWRAMAPGQGDPWLALGVSMMATIATCSWLAGRDPVRLADCALPVVVSKATSSLAGLSLFVFQAQHPLYVTVATTDLPLCVVTLVLWRRARLDTTP